MTTRGLYLLSDSIKAQHSSQLRIAGIEAEILFCCLLTKKIVAYSPRQMLNIVSTALAPTLLIQTSKINRYQFAYAGLLHGDAINNIYGAHGLFVVGYDDELRVFAELFYHVGKLAYVGVIERRIYLI